MKSKFVPYKEGVEMNQLRDAMLAGIKSREARLGEADTEVRAELNHEIGNLKSYIDVFDANPVIWEQFNDPEDLPVIEPMVMLIAELADGESLVIETTIRNSVAGQPFYG